MRPDEDVLEVGPGLGSLTLALLPAARRVLAVEVDPVLAGELPATVASFAPGLAGRLEVVTADAARVTGLPGDPVSVLVANLPYNAAVPVLLHLLDTVPSLGRGVVMVQAEVAARMTAPPGNRIYGVPTVKLAWYARLRRVGPVPRSVFWPVPRVDSALVAFTRHEPPGPQVSRRELFEVIDAAFAQRRKMLRSALASWAGSVTQAERILREAGRGPGGQGRIARRRGVRRHRGGAYDHQIVTAVTVRVPAKVNLQLAVGPVRPDGFHELVTVFHAISLYDEVTVSEADRRRVTVTGEGAATVPDGDDNLAVQAVAALARAVGLPPRQVPRVVSETSRHPGRRGAGCRDRDQETDTGGGRPGRRQRRRGGGAGRVQRAVADRPEPAGARGGGRGHRQRRGVRAGRRDIGRPGTR